MAWKRHLKHVVHAVVTPFWTWLPDCWNLHSDEKQHLAQSQQSLRGKANLTTWTWGGRWPKKPGQKWPFSWFRCLALVLECLRGAFGHVPPPPRAVKILGLDCLHRQSTELFFVVFFAAVFVFSCPFASRFAGRRCVYLSPLVYQVLCVRATSTEGIVLLLYPSQTLCLNGLNLRHGRPWTQVQFHASLAVWMKWEKNQTSFLFCWTIFFKKWQKLWLNRKVWPNLQMHSNSKSFTTEFQQNLKGCKKTQKCKKKCAKGTNLPRIKNHKKTLCSNPHKEMQRSRIRICDFWNLLTKQAEAATRTPHMCFTLPGKMPFHFPSFLPSFSSTVNPPLISVECPNYAQCPNKCAPLYFAPPRVWKYLPKKMHPQRRNTVTYKVRKRTQVCFLSS